MAEIALLFSWLTPTSLFILLNIVIATILFVSSTTADNPSHGRSDPSPSPLPPQPQPHLGRPPSFLSRVMSFNFSPAHYGPEPEPEHLVSRAVQPDPARPAEVARPPSFFSRVMSFNSSSHPKDGPDPEPEPDHPVDQADYADPGRPVEVARAPSLLSRVASFSLNRGVQPPLQGEGKGREEKKAGGAEKKKTKKKQQPVAAARGGGTTSLGSRDEEVDAKADDFINKFKQQLKMQRLESLLRYRNSG